MNIPNPFALKAYISPEYFCDRVKETEFLIKFATEQRNVVLFSQRRLGKTGLISHLKNTLPDKNYKLIYCDIMMTNSIQEFTYQLGKAVVNQGLSIKRKSLNAIANLFSSFTPVLSSEPLTGNLSIELKANKADFSINDIDKLFDFIKNSEKQYIIAIDEFQQILNYEDKGFEAYLRSRIQFLNNCSFIFSGSRKGMLLSMFNDVGRPFWQSSAFLELKPIDKDTYSLFISEKFTTAKRNISTEAIDLVFELTFGITYYVQLICHKLFSMRKSKIALGDVLTVLQEILLENEDFYLNYIQLFTRPQVKLLSAIAKEGKVARITSSEFINKYGLIATSSVKTMVDKFLEKDVLVDDNGTYYIQDLMLSYWLKYKSMG